MGIGGGIISRKLLIAVFLIASLSLTGIANVSAADSQTAQTTTSNTNTLNENINTQSKSENNYEDSAKTQNTADKNTKIVQTDTNIEDNSTHLRNSTKVTGTIQKNHISTKYPKNSTNNSVAEPTTTVSKTVTQQTSDNSAASEDSVTQSTTTVPETTVTQQVSDNNSVTEPTNASETTSTQQVSSNSSVTQSTTTTKTTVNSTNTKFDPNVEYASAGTVKYKTVKKTIKIKVYKYKKVKYKKWYKYKGKWRYKIYYKYKKVFVGYKYTVKTYKVPISTTTTSSVNSSSVDSLAKSLTNGKTTPYAKATAIFNWVRDNINYSFYYNTKYGATGTLKYRKGNCVDHSHLIVALARSAGLTTRYVHGTAKFTSGNTYGHVWAQFLINGKWYNADATSSKNSLGVINNWSSAIIKGYYNTLPF